MGEVKQGFISGLLPTQPLIHPLGNRGLPSSIAHKALSRDLTHENYLLIGHNEYFIIYWSNQSGYKKNSIMC